MNLAELIGAHKGTRSYNDLERDCGGDPSSQRLQQMATKPIREFLQPATIRSMSRGLGVSEIEIVLAAAESLGLDVARSVPRLVSYLPAGSDRLGDEDLLLLGRITRRLLFEPQQGGGSDGDKKRRTAADGGTGDHPESAADIQAVSEMEPISEGPAMTVGNAYDPNITMTRGTAVDEESGTADARRRGKKSRDR